ALAKDPEFKRLVRVVVEESLVRPFDPWVIVEKIRANPAHRERTSKLEQDFGPTLERITRILSIEVGKDGRERLSPDLARVLRRMVLKKDGRWVAVTTKRPVRRLSAAAGEG